MPLKGVRVLELAGLAPGPYCGMVLADFGASVIKVDRAAASQVVPDFLGSGKRSIALNLKSQAGIDIFKKLSSRSDVIIDPFRSGVMEKMGLGPKDLMDSNERLIYARLTGYGQKGAFAKVAGHDINYLGLSGLLSFFGRADQKPTPPVNLAADFGGGGLMCALGIILALYERTKSNKGQVIDASMVEGSAYLASWLIRSQNMSGLWGNRRGKNMLDSGAHFYDTYETKDGHYMCVGAIEPQFYHQFLNKLGVSSDELPHFGDFEKSRAKLEEIFKKKTRAQWCTIFDYTDACVTPVLSVMEAARHDHNRERDSFIIDDDNNVIPKPSPGLSRTPGESKALQSNPSPGEDTLEILREMNYEPKEIDDLLSSGAAIQASESSKL